MTPRVPPLFPFPPGPLGTVPPLFGRLLAEDPVPEVRLADGARIRLAMRHEDVRTVLADDRFSRHRAALLPGRGFGRSQGSGIVDLDPPEHARLRGPVAAAFGAERAERFAPRIEEIADDVLAGLPAGTGTVDLVTAYTAPFAGRVTCELLGLPGDRWRAVTSDVELLLLPRGAAEEDLAAARDRLGKALDELLAACRAAPGDSVAHALLATGPQDGAAPLTDEDRKLLLHGLIISGFVTIRDLLARHLFGVLSSPGLAARLAGDPALVPVAVWELLRFYPSTHDGLLRVATEDVVLSGSRIAAGEAVLPLVAAASRDPEVFPDPDVLDIARIADRAIAFGAGRHACPAAGLAVAELTAGVARLLAAFPGIAPAVPPEEIEHSSELLPLAVRSLPVVLGPRH
ncbi:cytochrome P450 [Streptomyces sp. VNUA116]|uniref:cytochrome P450 n=1 Tax=Streptomyces sp. VNUA116 TaxID=3062449 RepID=UPI002675CD9D|nr:cytochrome P450 [Streptomyces sp. VNUA116]WKU48927.1 cytochrome P450 [Streptomyces sp. VNUA116]